MEYVTYAIYVIALFFSIREFVRQFYKSKFEKTLAKDEIIVSAYVILGKDDEFHGWADVENLVYYRRNK